MDESRTIAETRTRIAAARSAGKTIGFVPTMGYLHRGHLSLVAESKRHSDYQVMSIFVNPLQFNDPRDFDAYPIDLDRDFSLAREAGVDLVFLPGVGEMYRDRLTFIDMEVFTDNLCGAHRPGHFRGVFTVVAKLFNIVQPDVAVFGQKDIQQAVSLEKMVTDLDFPLRMIIAPTIREDDGLAMSSRNVRLSPDERKRALAIHRSLRRAEELLSAGERSTAVITAAMDALIREGNPTSVDYLSVVRYRDLAVADRIDEKAVIAVAAFFGATRLIDNMVVDFENGRPQCRY